MIPRSPFQFIERDREVAHALAGGVINRVRDCRRDANDPDLAAMRSFRAEHMVKREGGPTDEQREQVTRMMKEDFGKLQAEGVLETHDDGMTVRMSDAKGRKLQFHFSFTPENRISALAMEPE
jgi:hypothetical protein